MKKKLGLLIALLTLTLVGCGSQAGASDIKGVDDLDGKKIGVIGQGNVPDLTLKTVLAKNSIGYSVIG